MNKKNYSLGFNKKKLKQWFLLWLMIGFGFFILMFLLVSTWIGVAVQEKCLIAKSQYKGDCAEALILTVDGNYNSFAERNDAIWALGQLGDNRAQTVLKKYYTDNIPKREPYDDVLSQYEIKKALNLTNGSFNITHFIWYNEKNIN